MKRLTEWFAHGEMDTVHLTVFGLLLYVLVFVPYSTFYGHFGVTPNEIGLTYLEILTRSGPPLLLLLLAAVALIYLPAHVLARGGPIRGYLLAGLALTIVVVLAAGVWRAYRLTDLVEGGSPVRSWPFGAVVNIRVDYATVTSGVEEKPVAPGNRVGEIPADPVTGKRATLDVTAPEVDLAVRSRSTVPVAARRTLLYFGQSSGVAVLYDPYQRQTIRLPAGDVTIYVE